MFIKRRLVEVSLIVSLGLCLLFIVGRYFHKNEESRYYRLEMEQEIEERGHPRSGMKPEIGVNISDHYTTVDVTVMAGTVAGDIGCGYLQLPVPTRICVHDPRRDKVVSLSIFLTGKWEEELLQEFTDALRRYPNIVVLDIGCNIGVYTLAAAKGNISVVAIDANLENLRLLSKSIALGNLTDRVTAIWNAVSDQRAPLSLETNPSNIGGSFVEPLNGRTVGQNVKKQVQSILLDDLADLFKDKPVAIKMDVELSEHNVIKGGMSFLKNVNVRFIQLEILHHRRRKSAKIIVSMLTSLGFKPFGNCLGAVSLGNLPVTAWPDDVCFLK